MTTEVGREPWTITGLPRTAESASPLAAPAVAASLVAFILVYFAVFGAGLVYILKLMAKPPGPRKSEPNDTPAHVAGIAHTAAVAPRLTGTTAGPAERPSITPPSGRSSL